MPLNVVLGQVLELRRRDQRHPPTTAAVNLRLLELDELGEQINNVMIDCPSALRMDLSSPPSPFGCVTIPSELMTATF